ncbi:hypothetical protein Ddc_12295 [Ditylenchus destructor]|nr:hypothetical protein Ddc_12295 [Ditylenchus destructor]
MMRKRNPAKSSIPTKCTENKKGLRRLQSPLYHAFKSDLAQREQKRTRIAADYNHPPLALVIGKYSPARIRARDSLIAPSPREETIGIGLAGYSAEFQDLWPSEMG